MIIRSSTPESKETGQESFNEDLLTECAMKIVQHLERQIVLNRDNSEKANRLACMNKFIQVCYLSNTEMPNED